MGIKTISSFLRLFFGVVVILFSKASLSQNIIAKEIIATRGNTIIQQSVFSGTFIPLEEVVLNNQEPQLKIQINSRWLHEVVKAQPEFLEIEMPMANGYERLQLVKKEVLTNEFKMVEASLSGNTKNITYSQILSYVGVVRGSEYESIVSFLIVDGRLISSINIGNRNYSLLPFNGDEGIYLLGLDNQSMQAKGQPFCGVADPPINKGDFQDISTPTVQSVVDKCVRLHFEITSGLQLMWGGLEPAIEKFMQVFGTVFALYYNDGITLKLNYLKIWTGNGPYDLNSSSAALNSFYANGGAIFGDFAQLLYEHKQGGFASLPSNLSCGVFRGVSGLHEGVADYPSYSWNAYVIAHELGHNLSSPHTHWCGWSGGAIDNCYTTEGGCPPGTEATGGGTIMSYCHLSGYGINFSKGFGPLPAARMRAAIAKATCFKSCYDVMACTDSIARNVKVGYDSNSGKVAISFHIGAGESYKVKWQQTGTNIRDSMVVNGPASRVLITPFCSEDNPKHTVNIQRICGSETGAMVSFELFPISTIPALVFDDTLICRGSFKTIKSTVNNPANQYKWYKNGTVLPGANLDSLIVNTSGQYFMKYKPGSTGNCWAESGQQTFNDLNHPLPGISKVYLDEYTLQFRDSSLYSSNHKWDLGNGETFIGKNPPAKNFFRSGRFSISLTTDGCGGTATIEDTVRIIVEEFDPNSPRMGIFQGIDLSIEENDCRGVGLFSSKKNAKLIYQFPDMPREGTIEYLIKIDSGHINGVSNAEIFYLFANSQNSRYPEDITLEINNATKIITYYSTNAPPYVANERGELAFPSNVDFRNWTSFGFSWGRKGTSFAINGAVLSKYFINTKKYGDTISKINGIPVGIGIGSGYLGWDSTIRGFYGKVDRIRISDIERDWKISKKSPVSIHVPVLNKVDTIKVCPVDGVLLKWENVFPGAAVKWVKNNMPIAGEQSIEFLAKDSGSYHIEVDYPSGLSCRSSAVFVRQTLPVISMVFEKVDVLTYRFSSTSVCADSVRWFFGDGTESALPNPEKRFNDFKKFAVCLRAYNLGGITTICDSVDIFRSWVDNFTDTTSGVGFRTKYEAGLCDKALSLSPLQVSGTNIPGFIQYPRNDIPSTGTIEVLVNAKGLYVPTASGTTYAPLFSISDGTGTTNSFVIAYPNGTIEFRRYNRASSTFTTFRVTGTPFRFNEWHVVSVAFGSSGSTIAVDGTIYATNTSLNFPIYGRDFYLGGMLFGTTTSWSALNGRIDKFRVSYIHNNFVMRNTVLSPELSILPKVGTNVCQGNGLTFSLNVNPNYSEVSPYATWYKNNEILLGNESSYSSTQFTNGDSLYFKYTTPVNNCYVQDTLLSKKIAITVNPSLPVYSLKSGVWSDASLWTTGKLPGPCDSVILTSGHIVLMDSSTVIRNLEISEGTTFEFPQNLKSITIGSSSSPNSSFINRGKFIFNQGTIQLNGSFQSTANSILVMDGGNLIINANGSGTLFSSPPGIHSFHIDGEVAEFQFLSGKLQISHPPFYNDSYSIYCPFDFGDSSVLRLGVGLVPSGYPLSQQAFRTDFFPNKIGKLELDGGPLTFRWMQVNKPLTIKGRVNIGVQSRMVLNAPLIVEN